MLASSATVSCMHARTRPPTPASDRIAFGLDEVAGRLGFSRRHVERLIQRGELPKVKVGRRSMVLAEDLDTFVEQLKAGAAA